MGRKSTWTEMALIENEIAKTKRFIAVRDLTGRAGRALLELKPCWMMSPLAVAQYADKQAITFDLCIIDEASQMPPEAAVGALLRSKQTMIVGDTNQLPPTNFFKKMIDDDDADEDGAVLDESILEMANATFRPRRRLRWHYRSRHAGLIKFSNRLVYDDDLIVFPSPEEVSSGMGVEYKFVRGRYKGGTNAIEAKAVVEAALGFMRTTPNRSLGVVTLNQKQRDLISEEFEYALNRHAAAQRYVDYWRDHKDGLEQFFIKNLENVQGDERDAIFIGTVYGPEEVGGRVMQRFGPINGLAGKRRLNVLFSRAKEKIVTFSSMSAADIVAEETANPGAYMLKRWLEYSATGVLDGGTATTGTPDSDFEWYVIEQVRSMGCEPIPQVGVAGYSIDIGVRHPQWPHGFILGVECDGASYHSAKSARDRDRLRQDVLEKLGWRLHRIWSTDWFMNPRRQTEILREVIAKRLEELKAKDTPDNNR
jgi:very-short-patch-repair endonuclease